MATEVIEIVVSIPHASGITADRDNNVFHFVHDVVLTEAAGNALFDALEAFYNGGAAPAPLSSWFSKSVDRGATKAGMKLYRTGDLTGHTIFGPPTMVRSWTIGAGENVNPLPDEVAVCLSFHANLAGVPETLAGPPITRPASRRRGRIFYGPMINSMVSPDGATQEPNVNIGLQLALLAAANQLSISSAAAGPEWAVWSKADAQARPVVGAFVDNAFDTQRRRGNEASSRQQLLF